MQLPGVATLCSCAALNSLMASSSPVNYLYVAGDPGEEGGGDQPYYNCSGFSLFCNMEVAQARLCWLARYVYARYLACQSVIRTVPDAVKVLPAVSRSVRVRE